MREPTPLSFSRRKVSRDWNHTPDSPGPVVAGCPACLAAQPKLGLWPKRRPRVGGGHLIGIGVDAGRLIFAEPAREGQFEPFFHWRCAMLGWALTFLIIALIAAVLGFGGLAAGAATIAKVLFVVFLVLFLVSLVAGVRRPIP